MHPVRNAIQLRPEEVKRYLRDEPRASIDGRRQRRFPNLAQDPHGTCLDTVSLRRPQSRLRSVINRLSVPSTRALPHAGTLQRRLAQCRRPIESPMMAIPLSQFTLSQDGSPHCSTSSAQAQRPLHRRALPEPCCCQTRRVYGAYAR